jgi:hypothetical protein
LPNKESVATFGGGFDSSGRDVVDSRECQLFEHRLNALADLRSDVIEISHDPHLFSCDNCQEKLVGYQAVLTLGGPQFLNSGSRDSDVEEFDLNKNVAVHNGRLASQRSFANPVRVRVFGWSTALAILFVLWAGVSGVPTDPIPSGRVSPDNMVGLHRAPTDFAEDLSATNVSEHTSELASGALAGNPLSRGLPQSWQAFHKIPAGGLLAARLPAVDLAGVDTRSLYQLGHYWQHASRLPGIELWQHPVNFAIGWFNQPAVLGEKPRCS